MIECWQKIEAPKAQFGQLYYFKIPLNYTTQIVD